MTLRPFFTFDLGICDERILKIHERARSAGLLVPSVFDRFRDRLCRDAPRLCDVTLQRFHDS